MEVAGLSGRVALVTGAAKRSGRAIALALADAGADVAVHYHRSASEAEDVVSQVRKLGRRSVGFAVDLRDPLATNQAFESVTAELGAIDILVNNVGAIIWKTLDSLTPGEWRDSLDTTLFVTLHACLAALPHMRKRRFGRIVNILDADADALQPVTYATPYKIGKTGALILTKSLAVDEAGSGITVNAVSPGTLEDSEKKPPLAQIPAGRYGTYQDLTQAVVFLVSERSSYLTGTNLKVSGGYLV